MNHKNIVLLAVRDEKSLYVLGKVLKAKNIAVSEFREPDLKDQLTAIAVEPNEEAYRLASHIPLALKDMSETRRKAAQESQELPRAPKSQ